ncbi:MAG: carbohydrate ABC transporter permease, partial [Cutibacterium avidum]|nr:carbohydrate ABC transporter permease [Cutibacterium avidum]
MRRHVGTALRHIFLALGGLVSLFPFYWMFVLASQPSSVIYKYPPVLTPGDRLGENVHTITDKINIWAAMTNT